MELLSALWAGVLGFVMIQGYLLALSFPLFRGGSASAKWILAAASLTCGLGAMFELLITLVGLEALPHLTYVQSPLWYLLAPFTFLYIRIYCQGKTLKWTDLFHLGPAIWVFMSLWEFYGLPAAHKLEHLNTITPASSASLQSIYFIVFSIQSALYMVWSLFLLKRVKNQNKPTTWILFFVGGLAFFTLFGLIVLVVLNLQIDLINTGNLFFVGLSAFLLVIFFKSVTSAKDLYQLGRPPGIDKPTFKKETALLYESICQFMAEQHPYRDPDYDIHLLAKTFGHSKNHLSTVIKEMSGKNFRDFLNEFRIEDAKRKLNSPISKQYTIQSIAGEAGFNSLATFYRVFKKAEGITPKAFIEE